ncbi:MAG: DUF2508 family protein [Clostridia bacterium]|nr:DUF2508 family protein [Clostridia bacterium]
MNGLFENTKNLFKGKPLKETTDAIHLVELMKTTRDELTRIERNYEEVTDEDLLDYFMYCRLATEQKYNYLIKQYRAITSECEKQECM